MVHAPRRHGMLRHLVDLGRTVLSIGDATTRLDGNEARGSVTIVTRQNDGGRLGPEIAGERNQEAIERLVLRRGFRACRDPEPMSDDGQLSIRRRRSPCAW